MKNNQVQNFKILKKYLKQSNQLMKRYQVYINDLSQQRYFEYDALYRIDYETRKFLVLLQNWINETQFNFDNLWETNLNLFSKMQPIIQKIYLNFQTTIFYELYDLDIHSDHFEGYYYFINLYKVNLLLPYMLAASIIKNQKINFDKLAFELANNIEIFEQYDGIINKVKKFDEFPEKKLLFSNFQYHSFFDLLDNLSNLSLYVTITSQNSKKIILKSRFYSLKGISLIVVFCVVLIVIIIILNLKL